MAPSRIILIRHAEKPAKEPGEAETHGVDPDGNPDKESLTPKGWQRAGALARYFAPAHTPLRPDVVFAAGVSAEDADDEREADDDHDADDDRDADGHDSSRSKRSIQTVTPLADLLKLAAVTGHPKDALADLVADVNGRDGVVLIAWEHKKLHEIVRKLTADAVDPGEWPDRFDLVWILEPAGTGWRLEQKGQHLLAGDRDP